MNNILIVDDDRALCEVITIYLNDYGFNVYSLHHSHLVLPWINNNEPDLVILDINLSSGNGFELCQEIRKNDEEIPIIFLTNHVSEENRIRSFKTGANDFVGKPFSLEELKLRIEARLKDKHLLKQKTKIKYKNLILDLQLGSLSNGDKNVVLTTTEVQIFRLLADHPTKVFSERDIFLNIWKDLYDQDTRMVNVHISNIRKKIKKVDPTNKYILTSWGKGYHFIG